MGDFNEVLSPEERKGHSHVTASIEAFRNWVNDMEVLDLPLLGRKYTWYRSNQVSWLDRAIIDSSWMGKFRDIKLLGLDRSISDHCPLLIECESVDWGPKPFRKLDVWFSNSSFNKLVEKEWMNLRDIPFHAKLRRLKDPIRKWNKQVFGNLDSRIKELEMEIQKLDILREEKELDVVEIARRIALKSQLWSWLERKKQYRLQLARTKNLKNKDKNTKYFHTITTFKKSRKCIKSLIGENSVVTNPRAIKKKITNFFKRLYSKDKSVCPKLDKFDGM